MLPRVGIFRRIRPVKAFGPIDAALTCAVVRGRNTRFTARITGSLP
jgi:hypothetical protein